MNSGAKGINGLVSKRHLCGLSREIRGGRLVGWLVVNYSIISIYLVAFVHNLVVFCAL